LSAEFTSPAGKVWKINGFYGSEEATAPSAPNEPGATGRGGARGGRGGVALGNPAWRIRFAANETGSWKYVVSAKDSTGTTKSQAGMFTCADSKLHGWVKVAPNKRYLCCDDGTSFYGVGVCHAWSVSTTTLTQMQGLGFNTYVYWNGTYDSAGGDNLIASMSSGVDKYDQGKCVRLDNLVNWSADRGIGMILVIWPHDYLCDNHGDMGTWPSKWTQNPFNKIVSSTNFYTDTNCWSLQAKMYRYIIARWGYSVGLQGWQTIDEIDGTTSDKYNRAAGNLWTAKNRQILPDKRSLQTPHQMLPSALSGTRETRPTTCQIPSTTEAPTRPLWSMLFAAFGTAIKSRASLAKAPWIGLPRRLTTGSGAASPVELPLLRCSGNSIKAGMPALRRNIPPSTSSSPTSTSADWSIPPRRK